MGCLDDQLEDSKHPELTYLDLQQRPVFFHQKKKKLPSRQMFIEFWGEYISYLDDPGI